MHTNPLPKTDFQLSEIVFGAWAIGGMFWGGTDQSDSVAAIHASLDAGVNAIDTAPVYGVGRSEELVGRALAGRRDGVRILTKFGLRWDTAEGTPHLDISDIDGTVYHVKRLSSRSSIIEECERSLRRLGTDRIDLYQQHWPDPAVPIEETAEALNQLLRDGKILAVGVCNYSAEQLEALGRLVPIASNQPPYSMVRRDIEREVLPHCRREGIGLVVYSPMQRGLLTGKIGMDHTFATGDNRAQDRFFQPENRRRILDMLEGIRPIAQAQDATLGQLAIRWVLDRPGITAALVGARNERQARENARAANLSLTPAERARIDEALASLALQS